MVRRPLFFIALGYVSAILLSHYGGFIYAIAGLTLLMIWLVHIYVQARPSWNGHRHRRAIILWLVLISYCFSLVNYNLTSIKLENQAQDMLAFAQSELEQGNTMSYTYGRVQRLEFKRSTSGEDYIQFLLKNDKGNVLVKLYETNVPLKPGMRARVYGNLSLPAERRNPGCFDYRLYLKSQGIPLVMTGKKVEIIEDDNSQSEMSRSYDALQERLFITKENFITRVEGNTDEGNAALIKSIMYGDKSLLDEETLGVFQRNGTAHILAVSGLHIGIIYGLILRTWILIGVISKSKICGRRGFTFLVFNIVFFGCYIIMSNFAPSVIRAVAMVLLHIFATWRNKRYDLNNAAFLIMLIALIKNPFVLFNVGFQMSFLAVLIIALLVPFVRGLFSGALASSGAIQLGLSPFIAYNFNCFSLLGIFVNLPVIFLAGLIVPMGILGMVTSSLVDSLSSIGEVGIELLEGLGSLLAKATAALVEALLWLNNLADIKDVTTFQVSSPSKWTICFYYLGLVAFASEEGRLAILRAGREVVQATGKDNVRNTWVYRLRHVTKLVIVLIISSLIFAGIVSDGFEKCSIIFVDVGQGNCACLRVDSGFWHKERIYLFDGGGNVNYKVGERILAPYLLKNGMKKVDGAFVTHLHTDHYSGICELSRLGMISRLYVYEGNGEKEEEIVGDTRLRPNRINYMYSGQTFQLMDKSNLISKEKITIDILWPKRKTKREYQYLIEHEEDENSSSLIMKITFSHEGIFKRVHETSVLITGDIGEEGERALLDVYGDSDILKADILSVGHHGSKTSTSDDFLAAVNPKYAVIQVGKNNYGHPHPETLNRLSYQGSKTYRNDNDGAVGFVIRRGRVMEAREITGKGK
ncbi:MAG: ComEC/Rec2 family competence protein [Bacillota bacterium]|nr:ComEC/Rec2 family competence protein [Bacillota bacterium]